MKHFTICWFLFSMAGCSAKAPNTAQDFYDLAIKVRNARHYEKAIDLFTRAIEIDPNFVKAYNSRGIAHRRNGDLDKAAKDYDTAIKIDPNFFKAYVNRGVVNEHLGNFDRAVADCDRAIEINPDYLDAYLNRGSYWRELGQLDKAMSDANHVLQVEPENVSAFFNRAMVWADKAYWREAISDYSSVIRNDPAEYKAYFNRARIREKTGDLSQAVSDYSNAIKINSKYGKAYACRRDIYLALRERVKAAADDERLSQVDPELWLTAKKSNLKPPENLTRSGHPSGVSGKLHQACWAGELWEVQKLLRSNSDSNKLADGHSPLHIAANRNQFAIMKLLVQAGANISLLNRDGLDVLEIMKRNGRARKSATNADFDEVLTTAIQRRLLELVALAEWASKQADTMTPYAVPTNEVRILGPDDLGDEIQRTYSQLARSAISDAILRTNMAFGEDDPRTKWVKWTMSGFAGTPRSRLLLAPATDNPMGKLLEPSFPNGQSPFFSPTAGATAGNVVFRKDSLPQFKLGSRESSIQLQKLLEDHPVLAMSALRFRSRDYGMTELHVVAERCQLPETEFRMKLMLLQGGNPNAVVTSQKLGGLGKDSDPRSQIGLTPLWCAAGEKEGAPIVKLLLDYGADPNLADDDGRTPIHQACLENNTEIVAMLLAGGANPLVVNHKGERPLNVTDSDEIRKMLLDSIAASE